LSNGHSGVENWSPAESGETFVQSLLDHYEPRIPNALDFEVPMTPDEARKFLESGSKRSSEIMDWQALNPVLLKGRLVIQSLRERARRF